MRGPHEDRLIVQPDLLQPPRAPLQRLDLLSDPARLLLTVPVADQADLLATLRLSEQRLAQSPLVRRDHAGGGGEDMLRRAIVLLQLHDRRARKILLEPQDVAHLGPAPAIDRLVVVADAADVLVRRRQQPQPQVLRDVGVLVFVHEDIAEPPLVLFQHIRMGLEDRDHVQQQIAKVAGVQIEQPPLVGRIELHPLVIEGPRIGQRHLVRREGLVLPAVDDPRQHPRRPAFLVDPLGHDQLLHQPDLVVGVQNREVRLQPHQLRMTAQELHADRVEGAEPRHPLHRLAHQPAHAVLHLARGLVGEGHGQDLVRTGRPGHQQMRDPRGQGPGLARARPRQHQHRTVERQHRLPLRRVQPLQIGPRAAAGHRPPAQGHRGRLEGIVFGITVHRAKIRPNTRQRNPLFTIRSQLMSSAPASSRPKYPRRRHRFFPWEKPTPLPKRPPRP